MPVACVKADVDVVAEGVIAAVPRLREKRFVGGLFGGR